MYLYIYKLQPELQKYLRHCTLFWLQWPGHDLVLVNPPPPLFKVASNTNPCSKLGLTTLNAGRGEVSILSHRPVTSSDLKQDRLFFRESVSTFLQLVVASPVNHSVNLSTVNKTGFHITPSNYSIRKCKIYAQ